MEVAVCKTRSTAVKSPRSGFFSRELVDVAMAVHLLERSLAFHLFDKFFPFGL